MSVGAMCRSIRHYDDSCTGIRAPLALMLVVAVILRFYTVDKQMPQIKQDLEARAAATTEAAR